MARFASANAASTRFADPRYANSKFADPMSEMNTTPLIDVLLVLLIMFIIAIPVASNSLPIDLPRPCIENCPPLPADATTNKVTINDRGTIYWNGTALDQPRLTRTLAAMRQLPVEPELQFEPAANASYAVTAEVMNVIEASGASRFGFVGNERYRRFDAD